MDKLKWAEEAQIEESLIGGSGGEQRLRRVGTAEHRMVAPHVDQLKWESCARVCGVHHPPRMSSASHYQPRLTRLMIRVPPYRLKETVAKPIVDDVLTAVQEADGKSPERLSRSGAARSLPRVALDLATTVERIQSVSD